MDFPTQAKRKRGDHLERAEPPSFLIFYKKKEKGGNLFIIKKKKLYSNPKKENKKLNQVTPTPPSLPRELRRTPG